MQVKLRPEAYSRFHICCQFAKGTSSGAVDGQEIKSEDINGSEEEEEEKNGWRSSERNF